MNDIHGISNMQVSVIDLQLSITTMGPDVGELMSAFLLGQTDIAALTKFNLGLAIKLPTGMVIPVAAEVGKTGYTNGTYSIHTPLESVIRALLKDHVNRYIIPELKKLQPPTTPPTITKEPGLAPVPVPVPNIDDDIPV